MKNLILSFALFLFVNQAQATIRRCNNNPSVIGTYTTAQAAHNAASPGDTIHLEPTVNGTYGSLVVTKKIVLISTGDFLTQNPGYQATLLSPGSCSTITVNAGSDFSVISAKSTGAITINTNNITVTNSHCSFLSISPSTIASNIVVSKCFIDNYLDMSSSGALNAVISNNYMSYIIMTSVSSAAIVYNTMLASSATTIYNSIFSNNIIIGSSNATFNNCNVSNNIAGSTQLPVTNGNVNSVPMSAVFVNFGAFSGDNYQLKPTYTNQDLGMYAGSNPYKPATTPSVPSIYDLIAPGSTPGNNLNVTLSTRSNN